MKKLSKHMSECHHQNGKVKMEKFGVGFGDFLALTLLHHPSFPDHWELGARTDRHSHHRQETRTCNAFNSKNIILSVCY